MSLLVGLAMLLAGFQPAAAETPVVTTDKADYAPGETVIVSGSNFAATTDYAIPVIRPDGFIVKGDGSFEDGWDTVTTDADGDFVYEYILNGIEGLYEVRVYDASWNDTGITDINNSVYDETPVASVTFTDAPEKVEQLWQCQPGPNNVATFDCTTAGPDGWKTGNNDGPFQEGDTVPYRTRFQNMVPTNEYRVQIEWDTSKGGKHALDYLKTYNATVLSADPTASLSGSVTWGTPSPFAIPNPDSIMQSDPEWGGVQDSGDFTIYNGTITSVSTYTLEKSDLSLVTEPPGTACTSGGCYDGDTSTYIDVFFTANDSDVLLAWGGHIASRIDWGNGNSAAAISGSPFHMRINEFFDVTNDDTLNVGNTDRSLSAAAVIFPGQITVEKETDPDGSAQTFDFTLIRPVDTVDVIESKLDLNGDGVIDTDDDGTFFDSDDSETFTVADGIITGSTGGDGLVNSFNVISGLIDVNGNTIVPEVDDFWLNLSGTATVIFSLADGGSSAFDSLIDFGDYTVQESVPTNWDLTSIDRLEIDDINDPDTDDTIDNPVNDETTFTLTETDQWTLTFNDTEDGQIIVEKQTLPDSDPETFVFAGDVGGTLGDGDTAAQAVAPGTYTSTETVPAGWALTDITCSDGNSTVDLETATATFNVEPGEIVTCTFTDTKAGQIIVEKQTLPDGDPETFVFAGDVGGTLGDGDTAAQAVAPGTYTSTETVPAGWALTNISCDDANSSGNTGTATATFNVQPGETVTCTFEDTKRGTIIVKKLTAPSPDPTNTSFTFTGDAADSILNGGDITVTDLLPGTYTSTETVPGDWDLTNITCDDTASSNPSSGNTGTATATFNVEPGEIVTCTFTNEQALECELEVEKTCCVPPPTSSSGDDCQGKVTELVLQYSPNECGTNNSQEGKAKCSGGNPGDAPITVTATGNDAGELKLN